MALAFAALLVFMTSGCFRLGFGVPPDGSGPGGDTGRLDGSVVGLGDGPGDGPRDGPGDGPRDGAHEGPCKPHCKGKACDADDGCGGKCTADCPKTTVHRWSKGFGGALDDTGHDLAVDSSGNVTVTGSFRGDVSFGGTTLTSKGGHDIFVASFSPSGAHRWSKSFGGSLNDFGYGVVLDGSGNVTVTGSFQGSVDFGGGPRKSAGSGDIFVARYSSSGAHLWSRRYGGAADDTGRGVVVDSSGNVIVTGAFQGTVELGGTPLVSKGNYDIFVACHGPTGTHRWSKRFGGSSFDVGYAVAVAGSGDVTVAGSFRGTTNFGGSPQTSKQGRARDLRGGVRPERCTPLVQELRRRLG